MDEDLKRKMKEKLDQGIITQELYDEILTRWKTTQDEDNKKEKNPEEKHENKEHERNSTVNVMGLGKFDDIYAKELTVSGSVKVSGNVDVSNMDVSGAASIGGNITLSGDLDISGSLVAGGSISCESLDLAGSLKAEELVSGKIDSSGWLTIKKGIKAEIINIDGAIESDGVDCNSIQIDISSTRGKITKLLCNTVNIRRQRRIFRSASIKIDEITCKTAELEGVIAKSIIGDDVTLGDGCEVDYVEASTLKMSENAIVRKRNIRDDNR
jgi:cytoskeletal protein CcmA (bactofilin family)